MAKNTCKLCCRRFASPRALAGHMRSHSVKVARSQISSASSASTSVAAGDYDADDARMAVQAYVLRDKPKRRVRLAESDFSDRESEAEYPAPDAKRVHAGSRDAEPVSSVSDAATPEEDVALSLMMLSRDSWPTVAWPPSSYPDDGEAALPAAAAEQKRTRFQCPACKKVFRSYQALGGHRASHVRGGRGGCCAPPLNPPPPSPASTHLQPLLECEEGSKPPPPHECPCCFRVFSSGQALGGHKRSQLCTAVADPAAAIKSLGLIDLNLPAPFEDLEVSAVSDPFLSARPGY